MKSQKMNKKFELLFSFSSQVRNGRPNLTLWVRSNICACGLESTRKFWEVAFAGGWGGIERTSFLLESCWAWGCLGRDSIERTSVLLESAVVDIGTSKGNLPEFAGRFQPTCTDIWPHPKCKVRPFLTSNENENENSNFLVIFRDFICLALPQMKTKTNLGIPAPSPTLISTRAAQMTRMTFNF